MLGRVYIERWWTPEQQQAARDQYDIDMREYWSQRQDQKRRDRLMLGLDGLGAESSGSSGVVIGALLGALAGYALTRQGSGAFVGAMLAPPVMYAAPMFYMRPSYGFWF